MGDRYPGTFITFEGIDGCGKSTQAEMLYEHLIKKDKKVFLTTEPSKDTNFGEKIRDLIFNYESDQATQFFLFMADRCNHVKQIIYPKLEEGFIVICDRYIHSTLAYQQEILDLIQGFNIYTKERTADHLVNFSSMSIKPEAIVFIDIDISIAKQRIENSNRNNNIYDNIPTDRFNELRRRFIKLHGISGRKGYLFKGDDTKESIHLSILQTIGHLLT